MSLFPPCLFPPLEEERNEYVAVLVADLDHPRWVPAARAGVGFAAQVRPTPSSLRYTDYLQWIAHDQPWQNSEAAVMAPKFRSAVLKRDQGYLQIKHTRARNFQVAGQLSQSPPESRAWSPNIRPAIRHQLVKKTARLFGRRWAPAACRMRDHTPEFGDARQRYSPASTIGAGAFDCSSSRPVLGGMPALSVNQEVGVNGDHARALSRSNPTSCCGRKPRGPAADPLRMLSNESGGDGALAGWRTASTPAAERAREYRVMLFGFRAPSAWLRAEGPREVQRWFSYSFPYYHIYGNQPMGSQRFTLTSSQLTVCLTSISFEHSSRVWSFVTSTAPTPAAWAAISKSLFASGSPIRSSVARAFAYARAAAESQGRISILDRNSSTAASVAAESFPRATPKRISASVSPRSDVVVDAHSCELAAGVP